MNGSAVIICKHLLDDPTCAKVAIRTEPVEPADSGWQVLCDLAHDPGDAKVVSVDELKRLVPSVAPILDTPAPCTFVFDGEGWTRQ